MSGEKRFSFLNNFTEITGLDLDDTLRSNRGDPSSDRGIMMLALSCLQQGVKMTDDEKETLRAAYHRLGNNDGV